MTDISGDCLRCGRCEGYGCACTTEEQKSAHIDHLLDLTRAQAARIAELETALETSATDLPATDEQALANPKVQSLVEALELAKKRLIWAARIIHNDTARDIAGTHVNDVEHALAALGKEPT